MGRPQDAVDVGERAIERLLGAARDSRRAYRQAGFYGSDLGHAYRLAGRYGDAETTLGGAIRGGASSTHYATFRVHSQLAILYAELDRIEEAQAEAAEVLKLVPNFSVDVYGERAPYKDPAQAQRDMAALRKAGLK